MAKQTTAEETSKATNDAWTGMLAISLIALVLGSVLLFLDYRQYPDEPPKGKSDPAKKAPKEPK